MDPFYHRNGVAVQDSIDVAAIGFAKDVRVVQQVVKVVKLSPFRVSRRRVAERPGGW
jgi:hypothetical protein